MVALPGSGLQVQRCGWKGFHIDEVSLSIETVGIVCADTGWGVARKRPKMIHDAIRPSPARMYLCRYATSLATSPVGEKCVGEMYVRGVKGNESLEVESRNRLSTRQLSRVTLTLL